MNHATLLLATLEPCWLWWLILSALAFILGAIIGCLLCGKRKRLAELETENAGLKARVVNWEKDYAGLKYELEEGEKDRKGLRVKLQSCEADKMILKGKLTKLQDAADETALSTAGPVMGVASGIADANILSANPEDLKIIEGIGPKIEELLNADGIRTWRDLADAEVNHIRAILDKAGKSFRLANPETWPEQAALAAAGRWGELSELQERLQGGVDRG